MAAGDKTQGRRRDLSTWSWSADDAPQPGDYGKPPDGRWYGVVPDGRIGMGNLSAHDVQEHDDGTITVSPSILVEDLHGHSWHGYLRAGIWEEV